MKKYIFFVLCIFIILFSGCASTGSGTKAPSINYDWGCDGAIESSFTMLLQNYLDEKEPIEKQIERMTTEIHRIENSGKLFPPGFFAHLGMLYAEVGNRTEAVNYYEIEKRLFPDSVSFMDFVIDII